MLWRGAQVKRKILRKSHSFLLLPILCLALGAGSGVLFCRLGAPSMAPELLRVDPASAAGGFFAAAARCARFPVFLFLISFSSFAPVLACAAVFARGFLLAYSLGALGVLGGAGGALCALAMELVSGVLLLPYVIMLASWAIYRQTRAPDRQAARIAAVTALLILVCGAADCVLTPWLTGFFPAG